MKILIFLLTVSVLLQFFGGLTKEIKPSLKLLLSSIGNSPYALFTVFCLLVFIKIDKIESFVNLITIDKTSIYESKTGCFMFNTIAYILILWFYYN